MQSHLVVSAKSVATLRTHTLARAPASKSARIDPLREGGWAARPLVLAAHGQMLLQPTRREIRSVHIWSAGSSLRVLLVLLRSAWLVFHAQAQDRRRQSHPMYGANAGVGHPIVEEYRVQPWRHLL